MDYSSRRENVEWWRRLRYRLLGRPKGEHEPVAAALGVSRSTISRAENEGRRGWYRYALLGLAFSEWSAGESGAWGQAADQLERLAEYGRELKKERAGSEEPTRT